MKKVTEIIIWVCLVAGVWASVNFVIHTAENRPQNLNDWGIVKDFPLNR